MSIKSTDFDSMLTHCPKISFYRCRFCNRRGDDCLNNCIDCLTLNNHDQICQRVHGKGPSKPEWDNLEMLYIARVLCKRCSLWHIRHSLGRHLFETQILRDQTRFPDQNSPSMAVDTVIKEADKGSPSGLLPYFELERMCTACSIKRPGGICDRCIEWNKENVSQRIFLINHHLHIVEGYCIWHKLVVFPSWSHPYSRLILEISNLF